MRNIASDFNLEEKETLLLKFYSIVSGLKGVDVSNDMQIKDLKVKIELQTGFITDEQAVCYQGEFLNNEKIVSNYGIIDYSIIKFITRLRRGISQIFVRTLDGKTVLFVVHKTDKISSIKKKVQENFGLASDEQKLVYQGGILEDERTVDEYQISEKSVINILARLRGGMQIFAKTMDGKTVAFEVQKLEKISDIKKKIQEKIGLAPDEHRLVYQGGILEDERTVEDYGIADRSVINFVARLRGSMLIFARTMEGKTVAFEVQKAVTISDIKKKIQEKLGLAPDEQKLVFQMEILEDERTVEDYGIFNRTVINVVAIRSMLIFAKIIDGITVTFYVQKAEKISDIKLKIQEKIGLAPDEHKLVYQGGILEEEKTVEDYGIADRSVIIIVARARGGMQIFAKIIDGITVNFYVQKSEKISDIKLKIQEKIGLALDVHKLIYQGGILEDERTVEDYGIADGSVINVVARLRGGMQIFAKTMDGKTVAFEVQKSEKIRDIKLKIQEKIGLAPEEQKLVYQGGILEEEKTVEDYGIADRSVINVVARARGGMQIFAKTMEGKTVAFNVQKAEKISDIKKKIQKKIGLAPDEHKLVYKGGMLEDERTVEDYGIADGSVIDVVERRGMQIFAITVNGKIMDVEVQKAESVRYMKNKIQDKIGLAPGEQILVYQAKEGDHILEDDEKTVGYYGIADGSVISVVVTMSCAMWLYVQTLDGRIMAVEAKKTEKISDIKNKIQKRTGQAPEDQILVYQEEEGNQILDDDERSVGDYGIADGSVINVIVMWGMQIYVKTNDGETLQFEVQKKDKITDIKLKIQEKIGLAPDEQKLVFQRGMLDDERTLEDYGIADMSVIDVVTRLK